MDLSGPWPVANRPAPGYRLRMTTTTQSLRKTPFHHFHQQHGAKLVDFAGWQMPLHYGSIIEEHNQVRNSGGLFDVSHMGRLRFTGKDAWRFLDRVCTRKIKTMSEGQCRYSLVCNERGGCRDDVLVYRLGDSEFLMVCNAANRAKLLEHFADAKGQMTFQMKDQTESTAMVAIQGPKVMNLIGNFSSEVPTLKKFRFTRKNLLLTKFLISRTGYTGEDGVEIIFPAGIASKAVQMMLKQVGDKDQQIIKPAGLGARDSLRLEAGMPLYGHEITEDLDPLSAGLNFAVTLNKGEQDDDVPRFIGQDALQEIADNGPGQKLMGLVLEGKRSARQDMKVLKDGKEIGFVTSGCFSPTLEKAIAMAYLDAAHATSGESVEVQLGTKTVNASVTTLPFYAAT